MGDVQKRQRWREHGRWRPAGVVSTQEAVWSSCGVWNSTTDFDTYVELGRMQQHVTQATGRRVDQGWSDSAEGETRLDAELGSSRSTGS